MRWFTYQGPSAGPWLRASDFTGVVRGLRHDFAGWLTPLAGWLQLGNVERAAECLRNITAELRADSALALLGQPDLEAALLIAKSQARLSGLELNVSVAGAVSGRGDTAGAGGHRPAAYGEGPAAVETHSGAQAAATKERADRPEPAVPFAVAVLAALRGIAARYGEAFRRAAHPCQQRLPVHLALESAELVLTVELPRLPETGPGWRGLAETVLTAAGFIPVGSSPPFSPERPVIGLAVVAPEPGREPDRERGREPGRESDRKRWTGPEPPTSPERPAGQDIGQDIGGEGPEPPAPEPPAPESPAAEPPSATLEIRCRW